MMVSVKEIPNETHDMKLRSQSLNFHQLQKQTTRKITQQSKTQEQLNDNNNNRKINNNAHNIANNNNNNLISAQLLKNIF